MYILAASTISHQPTFQNDGFSSELQALAPDSAIQHPDYTAFIPIQSRRRMTDVLKMAIACALNCLEKSGLEQPEAIIVGTSMGCNNSTKNFLDKIKTAGGGLLSPTSFIFSTHNTIAGQIALLLGNQEYNMTHTQNSLSFEQALLDAMLCIREGGKNILVGAADEMGNSLYNLNKRLNADNVQAACGASFFILSNEKPEGASIKKLVDVASFGLMDELPELIAAFLKTNGLRPEDVDLLLYACNSGKNLVELKKMVDPGKSVDYQKIAGSYFTNSAFALNFAVDILQQESHPVFAKNSKSILICNNFIPENLGLILLEA